MIKALTHNQMKIYNDNSRFILAECGRRFGKNEILLNKIANQALKARNQSIAYVATTFDQAKRIMRRRLIDYFPRGYLKKEPQNSSPITFDLYNGSHIYLFGGNNPDALRGEGHDAIFIDEIADQQEYLWSEVLEPTLMDNLGSAFMIGTPKGYGSWVKTLHNRDDFTYYNFSTHDGGIVDINELNRLELKMDTQVFKQEILAQYVSQTGLIYYNSNDNSLSGQEFNPLSDTVLSFDFNVDPMTCVMFQQNPIEPSSHVAVKEFIHRNSTTEPTAWAIKTWLDSQGFQGSLQITGDYSGNRRETPASRTDWHILEDNFKNYRNYKKRVKRTRSVRDRVNYTNQALKDGSVKINKEKCPELYKETQIIQWRDNGVQIESKGNKIGHLTDDLSYFCYNFKTLSEYIPKIIM